MSSTILVPVDFSDASHNAALYAAELAKTLKKELILFHAFMLPIPVTEVPFVMISVDELQIQQENKMEQELGDLLTKTGMEGKGLVRIGLASDEIKLICQEDDDICMVVMGMKGPEGIEMLIGSTTNHVIRKVKKPVLVIPHHTKFRAIKKVTFPTDFSFFGDRNFYKPLLDIMNAFQAELTILHILLYHSGESDKMKRGKEEIVKAFENESWKFENLEYSSVKDGIHHHLENKPSDLVVMVAHVHGFFQRVFAKHHTETMTHETHLPLLVLHDN